MQFPPMIRKLAPSLNWIAVATLIGALIGAIGALRVAWANAYFQESMRSLAGRVLEIGVLRGACLGLLGAAAGFLVFAVAWPAGRLIFRSSRMATVGAAVAVPALALLGIVAYKLNLDVLPSFLSATSLLGNAALLIAALVLWWLSVKWLTRHQERVRVMAANGVATAVMAGLLALVLGLPIGLAQLWKVEVDAQKPNVLIILIDTLRADRLGIYGYQRDTSPNLDKLASQGWRFNTAIAQASWTKPSVASMITGLYVRQTSVTGGGWGQQGKGRAVLVQTLVAQHLTLAEQLASLGYETAAFGKNFHLVPELGFSQGYLRYDWLQPIPIARLRKVAERIESRIAPLHYSARHLSAVEWINSRFLDWVDANPERKFFAYLHHIDVHWPYKSPAPFAGMFTTKASPEDFNATKFMPETVARLKRGVGETLNPDTLRAMSDAYDEGIRYVDDGLGKVFDALIRRGLYDDTLIIITADHGDEFMEHGLLGHGLTLYDEMIRVPLIVKFPCPGPHCAPRIVNPQVELVDVFPTVMSVLGAKPPANLVGRNLSEDAAESRIAYSELFTKIALRTPERKWIYDEQDDSGELFNLAQDPGETDDLAAREPATRDFLAARVLDFAATYRRDEAVHAHAVEADEKMLENLKALGYVK
jgi:arylsulfatase A-like enzyme